MTERNLNLPAPEPDDAPVDSPYDNPDAEQQHDLPAGVPDDLVAKETNPLAEGLPDGETAGDLLHDGKDPERHEGDAAPKDESDKE